MIGGWKRQRGLSIKTCFDRADVIVISDGIASVSKRTEAEWWKRKAERRMRCYGVLIGETDEVLGRIGQ